VLAIGLVVDDAIIVVEKREPPSGRRHETYGAPPSRRRGSWAGPIIAMTVVLIAVYVPIGFQGGLTGALFTEFAFTLVGAVTVSAVCGTDADAHDVVAHPEAAPATTAAAGRSGSSISSIGGSTRSAAGTSAGSMAA